MMHYSFEAPRAARVASKNNKMLMSGNLLNARYLPRRKCQEKRAERPPPPDGDRFLIAAFALTHFRFSLTSRRLKNRTRRERAIIYYLFTFRQRGKKPLHRSVSPVFTFPGIRGSSFFAGHTEKNGACKMEIGC